MEKKASKKYIVKGIIVNEGCLQIGFGFVVRARVTQRLTQFSKHCLASTLLFIHGLVHKVEIF